ncbi:MAG: hypothetical protein HKN85_08430 [Gammaproteobacteria bacterium]|nr:hypothetical protein [Gammaproteobacteria bacterium]
MQKNASIKLILAGLLLLAGLWWLWSTNERGAALSDRSPAGSQQEFKSAIKPVELADSSPPKTAETATGSTWTLTPLVKAEAGTEVLDTFDKASQSLSQGDQQMAIAELQKLIEKYPDQVEPYINLASIQASDGKLELARQTLMQGLNANENYATLFTNLQKIHGALAANAYQTALAEQGEAISTVELPLIPTIELNTVDQGALAAAALQLDDYQQRLKQSQDEVSQLVQKVAQSDQELASLNGKLAEAQERLQLSVASIESQQSESAEQTAALQDQLDQSQAQLAKLESDHQAELKGLQDNLAVVMAAADSKTQQSLEEQALANGLKEQLDQAQEQIASLRSDHQTRIARLQSDHQAELKGLQDNLEVVLASADSKAKQSLEEQAFANRLREQLDQPQKQIASLRSDHQTRIASLQSDHQAALKGLQDELQVVKASADSNVQQSLAERASATSLREQLDQARKQIASLQSEHQNELEELQQEQQQALAATDSKASGLANENAILKSRLQKAQQQLASIQSDHQLEVAILQERLRQQPDTQNTVAARQQNAADTSGQNKTRETAQQLSAADQGSGVEQEKEAIALVESWASAWSDQDVESYLALYRDGYVPRGSTLSNAAWVEQRRIRLTNKAFIQVEVTNFEVQKLPSAAGGEQFTVTFLQHYRSDSLDDKIRKRLRFQSGGSDWSQAKIIGEQVIR